MSLNWIPKKIVIDKDVKEDKGTQSILERFKDVPVEYVDSDVAHEMIEDTVYGMPELLGRNEFTTLIFYAGPVSLDHDEALMIITEFEA